jgi:hypothetical protein
LFIGVWEGDRLGSQEYWLRWWNAEQQMLPCGGEKVEQQSQFAEQQSQLAKRLAAQCHAIAWH